MKILRSLLCALIGTVLLFGITNCSSGSEGPTGGETIAQTPSNLVVSTLIKGSNAQNPYGDGSGVVDFSVKADNATTYKMLVNGETLTSSTGTFSYTFKALGVQEYTVYISAYKGEKFISKTLNIKVNVQAKLVWSDEFSTEGAPDPSKWTHEIGTGQDGWGNNELQYYTNRLQNSQVSDGTLKIRLIKEAFSGSTFTSARLVTKNKYQFKYGKIEFRAKLPTGGGTWPALWMLGSNIDQVSWPACGEIDVMEHVGNQQNQVFSTLHYPGNFGGNAVGGKTTLATASTQFHVYAAEWSPSHIKFYIDDTLYFTFNNSQSLPFNQDFFIIMNMAMGGNFGGTIDPLVTNATLEVDYVRVYQ